MGKMKDELRSMGVEVNDNLLEWKGPNGLRGDIREGRKKGPYDWTCKPCNVVVFCRNGKNDACHYKCFKCGGPNPDADHKNAPSHIIGKGKGGGGKGYGGGGDRRGGNSGRD